MPANATGWEPAQKLDGAKELPGQPRTVITFTMRPWLETNAPAPLQIILTPTETTSATEAEPAQKAGGAKVPPDDLNPIQMFDSQLSSY